MNRVRIIHSWSTYPKEVLHKPLLYVDYPPLYRL